MNKIRIFRDRVKKEIDWILSSVLGKIQRIKYLLSIYKARIRYIPFWTTWWNASVTSLGGLITLYLGYLSEVLANEGVGRFDASKAVSG